MPVQVLMPKVDMVQETGTLVEWCKPEGAAVNKGEPLFVIQTDKANIEIEAPASGILAGVKAKPNDVIPVTQLIAYILEPGESLLPVAPAETAITTQPVSAPVETQPPTSAPVPPEGDGRRVRATPLARQVARAMNIDLTQVTGRGPGGRVHKADVYAFAEQRREAPPPVSAAPPAPAALPRATVLRTVPLRGPRKIIAERMSHSAATAPHLTVSLRIDMSEVSRLQTHASPHIQERTGQRLSVTAIIARAVAATLPQHPFLNASLSGEEIILWKEIHLGIAASIEDYLIVPVIREAQGLNLEQITTALADLVERARSRRLTPSEMSGSTFTISNLGMFNIESFTPIINPPEAAILAVGGITDTPMALNGQVAIRPMMQVTLAADHRIVDGVAGARFLNDLKTTLENPYLLI